MSDIKYRYAKGPADQVICIDDINRDNKDSFQELTCFGCNGNLAPRLGEINVHHFYHPAGGENCSSESYLHWMTKTRVFEILERACADRRSISVEIPDKRRTIMVYLDGEVENRWRTPEVYPVIGDGSAAALEVMSEGFRADILVEGPQAERIFIEIAVTHACSEEKIASGIPIIEFDIEDQEQAERLFEILEEGFIKVEKAQYGASWIHAHNFPETIDRQERQTNRPRMSEDSAASVPPDVAQETPTKILPDLRSPEQKARDAEICRAIGKNVLASRAEAEERRAALKAFARDYPPSRFFPGLNR